MPGDVTNDLPPAIARHLAACNGHDIDAWMATFVPDALVNDVQREFAGAEAIRAFAAKEIFGDRVTFTPLRAVDRHRTCQAEPECLYRTFNGRLRDECLNEHWFKSLAHARSVIEAWRREYNEERPKRVPGGLTPAEYARRLTEKAITIPGKL